MPEILNPFESSDAFSMANLIAAINILPNNYGRINQLGIFSNSDGITTRTAIVEEQNGVLNLLKTQPVGAPAPQNKIGKRKVRSFTVPHIPLDDVIRPEEFQGIRAFGTESQLEMLSTVMNRHLQTAKNKYGITLEYLRMGAVKGIVYDADATTLFNYYTEFGITQKSVNFALGTTGTNVAAKCREVIRHIEDNLKGEMYSEIRCLVSEGFFDALIGHANVEKFYVNWEAAAQMTGQDPRKGFKFAGITFEEYRGTATDEDGTARPFIAADEGHCIPLGTMSTFQEVYAPGNFIEAANTPGIPLYVKQAMEKMGRWIDLHIESNPLPICMRPAILVKVTKA